MQKRFVFAVAMGLAAGAAAQDARRAKPAEPSAAVPALRYESALAGYRPYTEEKLASWREVNEEMRRLGGHVGHFSGTTAKDTNPVQRAPQAGHGAHK